MNFFIISGAPNTGKTSVLNVLANEFLNHICEYSDKSTPRVPDESTPDLVTNNPSYFTTGLY